MVLPSEKYGLTCIILMRGAHADQAARCHPLTPSTRHIPEPPARALLAAGASVPALMESMP